MTLAKRALRVAATRERAKEEVARSMNHRAVRRVLFVDDDSNLLEGVTNSLRREPYRVMTAASAHKALKVLARHQTDVVVSDECMPGMSGSDFLAEVCREYPRTVRMLLTGQASVEAAIRAVNEGQIFRFLTKPLAPSELARNVRNAMELAERLAASSPGLLEARTRQATLSRLERQHPGISVVERSAEGAVILGESAAPPAGELDPEADFER